MYMDIKRYVNIKSIVEVKYKECEIYIYPPVFRHERRNINFHYLLVSQLQVVGDLMHTVDSQLQVDCKVDQQLSRHLHLDTLQVYYMQ